MPTISYDRFEGGIDLSRPGNIQDSNRFRSLVNAYVTSGKTVKKRPGARYRWSWGTGVKGLYTGIGHLTGFFGDGNTDAGAVTPYTFDQNQDKFVTTKVRRSGGGVNADNTVLSVRTAFRFADALYVVAEMGSGVRHFYATTSSDNDVTDVNCPHGDYALTLANKVFAVSPTGTVRFSKTDDAIDWTTADDAGFLPTDRKTKSGQSPKTLGEWEGKLIVFYDDATQLWSVDPDPAEMRFDKRIAVGAAYIDAHANVGNDLFFHNAKGVRSIVLNSQNGNAMDLDIGVPVDRLIPDFVTPSYNVFSRYFEGLGQFWSINGNRALVYSFSKTAKVYAWAEYVFPWRIQGAAQYGTQVYLRSEAGDIYELDPDYPYDDDASLACTVLGQFRDPLAWKDVFPNVGKTVVESSGLLPFLDFKQPAALKQINGMHVVSVRDASGIVDITGTSRSFKIDHLFRSDSGGREIWAGPLELVDMPDDTRPYGMIPLGIMAPAIAARFTHRAAERFELSALVYQYESLW